MSLRASESLFFRDFNVKTLETNGDYEIWAEDMREYFNVSNYPALFRAISNGEDIDKEVDYEAQEEPSAQEAKVNFDLRLKTLMSQAKYAIYRSLGDSIKKSISKDNLDTSTPQNLFNAVRSCFFKNEEGTVQQLRDDISLWDHEKAGN